MRYSYETVERFLVHSEMEGSKMYCEFQVPGTGETIQSEASVKRSSGVKSQVERVMKRTATNQLRRSASRILRQTLGRNLIGRTVATAFNTASRPNNLGGFSYSSEEKQQAIVDAFVKVAAYFPVEEERKTTNSRKKISINKRDNQQERPPIERTVEKRQSPRREPQKRAPRNRQGQSPFEQQLLKYPVKNRFDQEILARMLVELANADGNISEEERAFLASFISPDIGRIEHLLLMDPISPIECEEVSPNAKKSIYMLAWTISLVDYDINRAEERILKEYAEMFELTEEETTSMIEMAKAYALEEALTPTMSRSELYSLAERLEMTQEEALRCQIQWKKRS